jgi:1,4-alpha-glucan branching enzyme
LAKSKSAGRKRVIFSVKANPGRKVNLAGSFNAWSKNEKEMKDPKGNGHFTAQLMLHKGKYEYKFLINDEWHIDPQCANWIKNDCGTLNSFITV